MPNLQKTRLFGVILVDRVKNPVLAIVSFCIYLWQTEFLLHRKQLMVFLLNAYV